MIGSRILNYLKLFIQYKKLTKNSPLSQVRPTSIQVSRSWPHMNIRITYAEGFL